MPTAPDPDRALTLAIDQGTHASRALVFDARGELLASGVQPIGLERPRPDWAEQSGEEVVASVFAAAEQTVAALGPRRAELAAVGLASQRSNAVCWDRESGQALSPIFSWQDRRAHAWLRQFEARGEEVHRRSGLFLSPHYGASKLRWSLDNLPAVGEALRAGRLAWGPMASFLIFRMVEERSLLADPQCASRTQLWNLERRDWDPELLALFGLPAGHLPRCAPTCHPYGTMVVGGRRLPLRAVNGDQSAALFGFGWPREDSAYINMGTGAFVQRPTTRMPGYAPRLLTGIVLQDESTVLYMLEGTVNGAGSALDWLGRELGEELGAELAGEPGGTNLLAALPGWLARAGEPPLFLNGISGLGAPFWQADFPSRFLGAGAPWQKAVALVESIAFLLLANLEEMAAFAPPPVQIFISGGVSRLDGLCQRIADLAALPVLRRDDPEATARGIAYLAAGRPTTWTHGAEGSRFDPRPNAALSTRYRRWRAEMPEVPRG
jgi:glycerol kinase